MNKAKLGKVAILLLGMMIFWISEPLWQVQADSLKMEYNNPKKAKKGGTLRVGYINNGAFKGIFSPEIADDGPTLEIAQFGMVSLFKIDPNNEFKHGGLADISFDRKTKTATVKISKRAKWSDGHPVVARDLSFAYEIVANKAVGSSHYSEELENIEGMREYHNGTANKISGLEEKDDKTLVIHFKKMKPTMTTTGSGYILESAEPSHYLKNVAMKDLVASDKLRKKPLFYGPFKIKKLVQGESIEWVPNTYYYKKPHVAKIIVETIDNSKAVAAIKAGKFDIMLAQSPQIYNALKKDKDLVQLGKKNYYYSYMGFRVGKLDKDGNNVMDKHTPSSDRALRQAMAYAMNVEQVIKKSSSGLSYRANTVVPDVFGKWNAKEVKGYKLDMKKAKKLLDDAGYKLQKDGYRTKPNGKKLTLTLMADDSSKSQEETIKNYIQQWKELGVRVKLLNGRFQEFNTMVEKLSSGSTDYDLWFGAWGVTPEPTDIANSYTVTSAYNNGHFVTKENTELINSLKSDKAFDEKYRLKQFHKWQAYMDKEAFVVPIAFTHDTISVTKHVKNVSLDPNKDNDLWVDVALTK